jgi:hypothetical protein
VFEVPDSAAPSECAVIEVIFRRFGLAMILS